MEHNFTDTPLRFFSFMHLLDVNTDVDVDLDVDVNVLDVHVVVVLVGDVDINVVVDVDINVFGIFKYAKQIWRQATCFLQLNLV